MVLILSEANDQSTVDIIQWLTYYKQPYVRINEKDLIKIKHISLETNDLILEINEEQVLNLNTVKSFWYRRGYYNSLLFSKEPPKGFDEFLANELRIINQYISYHNTKVKSINDRNNVFPNKLIVLDKAKQIGLLIPPTLITTNKQELLEFYNQHHSIISKAIREGHIVNEYFTLGFFTEQITEQMIQKLPKYFFPSLFQKQIEKKYELRVFFMNERYYPMAIFSQNDLQTSVDFRKYNDKKPNRTVPFLLPYDIQQKLIVLMKKLDLNSGSIDILVDINNDYYFLEVNPVGQFGMTSYPCNYFLEKEIANYLMS